MGESPGGGLERGGVGWPFVDGASDHRCAAATAPPVSAERARASEQVVQDVARAAAVDPRQLRVRGLRAGSVIVDLALIPSPPGAPAGRDLWEIARGLEAQASEGCIWRRRGAGSGLAGFVCGGGVH